MPKASVSHAGRKDRLRVQFTTYHPEPKKAIEERCQKSPGFKRLLEAAAYAWVNRGKSNPQLCGNTPVAEQALLKAISAFSQPHCAQLPKGAAASWSYLIPKKRKVGNKSFRVLTPVTKLEAICTMQQEATLDGFKVRKLLGYSASISWRAAAKLNRVHAPPFFYFVPVSEDPIDTSHDLNPDENEHFRNDNGSYDEAGILQPFKPKQSEQWETAFGSRVEAWNADPFSYYQVPTPKYFYPASPATPIRASKGKKARWHIDQHGVSELLRYRDHCQSCQQALKHLALRQEKAKALPEAPLYQADLKTAAKHLLEREYALSLARRLRLDADDAEVLAYAQTDVSESILQLLEQQVEELSGKAPSGLIAALAKARLEAKEQMKQAQRFAFGLAALEKAVSQGLTV